ncbi:protein Niban 2a [Colossoma macropomum]|uniref:protein Niban 2a n=1 Tax=Colossoma macropomum TaxID=42526 RepID=UPI001863BB32|nr:protein Niban 2a [Colossoma macropomum]
MGDVVSTHLDEGRREMISARTRQVMAEFGKLYEQQYAVALFNSVRFEIEGGGNAQSQLLHRKDPLQDKSIFSGDLFQYLEENKKWRNRFIYVADSYNISYYENKLAHDRGLHPKGVINCAGYKALTSMDEYLELLNSCLPDTKAKAGNSPFLKCASSYLLILWHPYARHHYFYVRTEKEQKKWLAVFQDCVRHTNNGLSEENKVLTPAFTDSVRLYRQAEGHYGTWDMMCGDPPRILANLVMETLHQDLRTLIGPRLKGKLQQRQRDWMLISDAVYRQVLAQTRVQYEGLVQACEAERPRLDASLRTDMDQIITSKEHISGRIRALVHPRAEQLLRSNVQPYIASILEALMEPASRGFSEVREVLFREMVEVSKNTLNDGGKDALGKHMEKISMLAFHPVKMQSCYEKMEQLSLEGLQQRFEVSSPSVFIQRAQILMREQMDNAVYTFEQLLHQSLEGQSGEQLYKIIQRCQDRVLKKYDYDSSTVRKKFFREALLQVIIPYMLKQLYPVYSTELPKFKELIFEDFSRFILVENVFEEVVLQSVTKDIMMAVKEAAVQRKHNLYRDSMVLTNSDPNLHLLGENPIDWAQQYGGGEEQVGLGNRKRRQVVSMIVPEGMAPLPYGSCLEVPGVEEIPEETEAQVSEEVPEKPLRTLEYLHQQPLSPTKSTAPKEPGSPDSVDGIRQLINPVLEIVLPLSEEGDDPVLTNGMVHLEEGQEIKAITTVTEVLPGDTAVESAIQELDIVVEEDDGERLVECAVDSDVELVPASTYSSPRHHDDSGFQSPTNEHREEEETQPLKEELRAGEEIVDPEQVMVTLEQEGKVSNDETGETKEEIAEDDSDVVSEI